MVLPTDALVGLDDPGRSDMSACVEKVQGTRHDPKDVGRWNKRQRDMEKRKEMRQKAEEAGEGDDKGGPAQSHKRTRKTYKIGPQKEIVLYSKDEDDQPDEDEPNGEGGAAVSTHGLQHGERVAEAIAKEGDKDVAGRRNEREVAEPSGQVVQERDTEAMHGSLEEERLRQLCIASVPLPVANNRAEHWRKEEAKVETVEDAEHENAPNGEGAQQREELAELLSEAARNTKQDTENEERAVFRLDCGILPRSELVRSSRWYDSRFKIGRTTDNEHRGQANEPKGSDNKTADEVLSVTRGVATSTTIKFTGERIVQLLRQASGRAKIYSDDGGMFHVWAQLLTEVDAIVQWKDLPENALAETANIALELSEWTSSVGGEEELTKDQRLSKVIAVGEQLFGSLYNWLIDRIHHIREVLLLSILQKYTVVLMVKFMQQIVGQVLATRGVNKNDLAAVLTAQMDDYATRKVRGKDPIMMRLVELHVKGVEDRRTLIAESSENDWMLQDLIQLRPGQSSGVMHYPGQSVTVWHEAGTVLWCSTMLVEAERRGIALCRGGRTLAGTTSEQLYVNVGRALVEQTKNIISALSVSTVRDLTRVRQGRKEWASLPGLDSIIKRLRAQECPQGKMILRPWQCWLVEEDHEWYVAEILGLEEDTVTIRKWLPQGKTDRLRRAKAAGQLLTIATSSESRGEGSNDRIPYEKLDGRLTTRVILSKDTLKYGKLQRKVLTLLEEEAPARTVEHLEPPSRLVTEVATSLVEVTGKLDIFVDGSWEVAPSPPSAVFYMEDRVILAGAAMVLMKRSDDWQKHRVVTVRITNGGALGPASAYTMELLVLVIAQLLREELKLDAPIYTDCKAALSALMRPDKLRYKAKRRDLLLLTAGSKLVRTGHVRSHPEKYVRDKNKWNRYMYGNHIADRVCMGDYKSVNEVAGDVRSLN